jgi:hypothetical protein
VLVEATGLFLAVPDFFEDDAEGWEPGKAAPTT